MNEILERGVSALESMAKSIDGSNQIEFYLVIITLITAISSILFGYFSLTESKKQNKISWTKQDDEHFERVRPWIVIKTPIPFQVQYEYNTEPYERHIERTIAEQRQAKSVTVAFLYSNKSQRVAKKLGRIYHHSFNQFTKEEFLKIGEEQMNMELPPDQEQSWQLQIPYNNWININTTPIFLGLQLSYDNGRTRSTSGGLYKLSMSGFSIIETWYT